MKEKFVLLPPDDLQKLASTFEVHTFNNDFDLVYEHQIPSAGIVLLDGSIELIKDSEVSQVIGPGHLLGLNQLLSGRPVKHGCRVKTNSKIILLGKSEVLASLNDRRSPFFPIFSSSK